MIRLITVSKLIIILFIFGILFASCTPSVITQETINPQPTATQEQTATQTALTPITAITETPSAIDLTTLDGPLLLLQTSVDAFHLLDLATYSFIPYDLPGMFKDQRLSSQLSPNGKYLLLFTSDQSFEIDNILGKETSFSYDFRQDAFGSNVEQAVEAALQVFPGYTSDFMRDLIDKTLLQGLQNIQWYQNDQTLLIIKEGSEANTNLALLDLSTGQTELLEQNPQFVEDYWLNPGDEKVLLKKGFSVAPNDWRDDHYFILNFVSETSFEIPIPENSEKPSIFWFSDDLIGIIHQTGFAGSTDFSLFTLSDLDSRLIINDTFSSLHTFGPDILTIYQDRDKHSTNLTLYSINGDVLATQELTGICSIKRKINSSSLILNCEAESKLVEGQELTVTDFGEPIFLISRSPDRQIYILITEDKNTSLVSSDLQEQTPIQLQGEPLEILWLPDSSGFLYRTARELIHYDISSSANTLLLTSDLFGDYRNLNAVWLTLD